MSLVESCRSFGKLYHKFGAFPWAGAFRSNRAAVQFHQILDDRKSQAETAILSPDRTISLRKALEQVGQKVRTYSFAGFCTFNFM